MNSRPLTARGPLRRLRAFVNEALRDQDREFTSGPIDRALGLLAIPMMLEMAMESVFIVVDIFFVSRLGTAAVAAVGITEALVTVLYAIAIGLGTGVTAIVARHVGAREFDRAALATGQAVWIGAALAVGVGIAGATHADELLALMGADRTVIEGGRGYTAMLLGGSASILFLFMLTSAFRGAGDANVALRALVLANAANLVLDPCLIFGLGPFPELGVTGAAVATTAGRSLGCLYLAWILLAGAGRLRLARRHLRVAPGMIRRILAVSAGGVGQFLIATSSWIAIMRIVAVYGSAPVAAYTIALRVLEFAILPAWGLGNAAATLVGQNLGAGHPERARASAWRAARYNTVFMTVLGVVLLLLADGVVTLFTDEPDVRRYGTLCLRILGLGYPAYAIGMIMVQALNGAGDTRSPALMNLFCFWLVQIPLAWWLATAASMGPTGVFVSIVVSESLLTAVAVAWFRRGAWQNRSV